MDSVSQKTQISISLSSILHILTPKLLMIKELWIIKLFGGNSMINTDSTMLVMLE